ncbi:unnamed protein product [Amoebophrya sp. A25]|nr:unnamed protein product [Amoebophrya sp. A25]|eukprot:GSA25T00025237001.1
MAASWRLPIDPAMREIRTGSRDTTRRAGKLVLICAALSDFASFLHSQHQRGFAGVWAQKQSKAEMDFPQGGTSRKHIFASAPLREASVLNQTMYVELLGRHKSVSYDLNSQWKTMEQGFLNSYPYHGNTRTRLNKDARGVNLCVYLSLEHHCKLPPKDPSEVLFVAPDTLQLFSYMNRPVLQFTGRLRAIFSVLDAFFGVDGSFSVVELGSAKGYFALEMANRYRSSRIYAIEGAAGLGTTTAGENAASFSDGATLVLREEKATRMQAMWVALLRMEDRLRIVPETWHSIGVSKTARKTQRFYKEAMSEMIGKRVHNSLLPICANFTCNSKAEDQAGDENSGFAAQHFNGGLGMHYSDWTDANGFLNKEALEDAIFANHNDATAGVVNTTSAAYLSPFNTEKELKAFRPPDVLLSLSVFHHLHSHSVKLKFVDAESRENLVDLGASVLQTAPVHFFELPAENLLRTMWTFFPDAESFLLEACERAFGPQYPSDPAKAAKTQPVTEELYDEMMRHRKGGPKPSSYSSVAPRAWDMYGPMFQNEWWGWRYTFAIVNHRALTVHQATAQAKTASVGQEEIIAGKSFHHPDNSFFSYVVKVDPENGELPWERKGGVAVNTKAHPKASEVGAGARQASKKVEEKPQKATFDPWASKLLEEIEKQKRKVHGEDERKKEL